MTLEPLPQYQKPITTKGIIASIDIDLIKMEMKRAYNMGGYEFGDQPYPGFVVRIRTEDGIEGFSEMFISPGWYTTDTPAGTMYLVKKVFAPALLGKSVFDLAQHDDTMENLWMGNYWAKTMLNIALTDAAAKTLGRPIVDLLGGKVRDRVPLSASIGTETPEKMAKIAAEYLKRGFKTIKLKIGERGNPDLDIARVKTVREEIGAGIKIRLDANGALDVSDSISLINKLEKFELEHVEQPIDAWDLDGMARIRNAIGVSLMADECVHTARDALSCIRAGAADVIKIKIAKCGGFRRAQEIVTICEQTGTDVVIGNGINTSAASIPELAIACANSAFKSAGEFPGPDKLVGDIMIKPMEIVDGDAILPAGPGLGSDLDYDALNKFSADTVHMLS